MGRLIDVGKVMEELKVIYERDHTAKVDIGSMICLIGEQPTAYDVDRVLEELEANTMCYDSFYDCYGECKDCSDCAINRKEAVNIIKRGGIDGYKVL